MRAFRVVDEERGMKLNASLTCDALSIDMRRIRSMLDVAVVVAAIMVLRGILFVSVLSER